MKIITQNRKAYFNYQIEDEFEAGIMLLGTEIKAIRAGKININDAYISEKNGELFLTNSFIGSYSQASIFNHPENRERKILLHKKEIVKLLGKINLKGYSVIPIKLIFNNRNIVKVILAYAKGKKLHDKRESIKKRDEGRRMAREGD